jgi:hypothetical protein
MKALLSVLAVLTALPVTAVLSQADLRPEKVYIAEARKTQTYIKDGLIVGGDQAIQDVVVKDIRRAKNPLFERIVIDLEGNQGGEPAAIQRPPYYQVAVTPDENRLVFTVWGKPKLTLDAKKVLAAFKNSRSIEAVQLFPKVEKDSWTFALDMKAAQAVEVFELSDPVRIIIDIRSSKNTL